MKSHLALIFCLSLYVSSAGAIPGHIGGGFGEPDDDRIEALTCELLLTKGSDLSAMNEKVADVIAYLDQSKIYAVSSYRSSPAILAIFGLTEADTKSPKSAHLKLGYNDNHVQISRNKKVVARFPLLLPAKPLHAYQSVWADPAQLNEMVLLPDSSLGLSSSNLYRAYGLPLGVVLKENTASRMFFTMHNKGELHLLEFGIDIRQENLEDFGLKTCTNKILTETGWWCRFNVISALTEP